VTSITLGVVGATTVVEVGSVTMEVVVAGAGVVSGVDVEVSVTIMVVVGEVVKLTEVVVMTVVMTESVPEALSDMADQDVFEAVHWREGRSLGWSKPANAIREPAQA